MYQPRHFAMTERTALRAVIDEHPFATLALVTGCGVMADHLPLLFEPEGEEHGVLRGHIARANPLWRGGETDALAIFHGPKAYITPNWYPDKREHGRVVPTWNYQVVHAHGRLRFIHDPAWLLGLVTDLSERFERTQAMPWSIDDAPAAYIEGLCRAIVGVELTVTQLIGKHKASQHKSDAEREAIYRGLLAEDGFGAADAACLSGGGMPS
jgi:transcriptional regulator